MGINHRTMLTTMIFRSLRNNLSISIWTLLTLAMCAALVTLFTTITFQVRAKMSQTLRQLGANAVAYPLARGETDWTAFEREAGNGNIQFVRLGVRVGLVRESPLAIVAAAPAALQALTPYWAVSGKRPLAAGECLVGRHVSEALGVKPGQSLNVEWPDGSPGTALAVVGIADSGDEDDERVFTVAPVGPADFSYALLSVSGGEAALARVQQTLAAASPLIAVKPLRQIVHGEEQVLAKISVLCLTALGAVLALTALGVSAAMLARVVQRKKEFALLQALGAHRRGIVKFLLAESATLGGIAALLGFVLGTALAIVVMWQIFRVSIAPDALALVAALVVTTAVALLAGAIACWRTLRLQPAAILKGE